VADNLLEYRDLAKANSPFNLDLILFSKTVIRPTKFCFFVGGKSVN
jgi:hypothetical protein